MPDPDVEFECTCGSADFYTYIDETIFAYTDGYGDVHEYGDVEDSDHTWNTPYYCQNCSKTYSNLPPYSHEQEYIKDKERAYLHKKGTGCPMCGGNNIECGPFEADGNRAWQSCWCVDCDAAWDDTYHLREVEITAWSDDQIPSETPPPAPEIPNPNEAFVNENN